MNNNNPNYLSDSSIKTPIFNSPNPESPQSVTQQQKRQHSLSKYMMNNSNKRLSNNNGEYSSFLSNQTQQLPNMSQSQASSQFQSTTQQSPQIAPSQTNQFPMNARLYNNNQRQSMLHQQPNQLHPLTNQPPGLQLSQASTQSQQQPLRKNIFQQFPSMGGSAGAGVQNFTKTPTPSSYEVPSSPNLNAGASNQNVSESPDSNPNVDKSQVPLSNQYSTAQSQTTEVEPSDTMSKVASTSQQQPREMTEEEQQLATKLKETYKNIVNYEEIVQKNCLDITIKTNHISNGSATGSYNASTRSASMSPTLTPQNSSIVNNARISELSNELWTVYHHNITLLDNYTDFLVTALKPSSNKTKDHFKTGKNIVDLYKIPRRMWVYGVVAFLEVLKNIINIFQDHEICSCFIGHCFTIISNLSDPALDMEGWWSEKLGDLSRMAIALYSSRFIDWKISAEYWYSVSMRTLYGHGKIYYHMCTVQQDNLDALVNIGKSVICRDPFVPTQQYLRLVVENICTQRNILSLLELPIIDFIKIHKVLLSINTNHYENSSNNGNSNSIENIHDTQLQYGIDLVSRYGITFGSDSTGYNFFTRDLYSSTGVNTVSDPHTPFYLSHQQQTGINSVEKLNFWLNKGPLFAISNINHIIGLGDARNPFAKLFALPEALKERKDKKDRKRKSKASISEDFSNTNTLLSSSTSLSGQTVTASELSTENWFYCLQFLNKSVLELSIRILKHYLVGPVEASYGHIIIWLYFLIAIGEATNKNPKSKNMIFWLFKKVFPWESFINYSNTILQIVKSNSLMNKTCKQFVDSSPNYIQFFNENETLPEVWKCWGSLWFDFISLKTDYSDFETAGIVDYNIFDLPVSGIKSNFKNMASNEATRIKDSFDDNNDRIIRIVLLTRFIADNYEFGIVRTLDGFKYNQEFTNNLNEDIISVDINSQVEDFLYGDNRFISHNFFENLNWENIINPELIGSLDNSAIDNEWFNEDKDSNEDLDHDNDQDDEFSVVDNEQMIRDYGESELEEERRNDRQALEDQVNKLYQQQHLLHTNPTFSSINNPDADFYNSMINSENLSMVNENNNSIDGDLGDKMDSKLTYITLDTNIWLKHCGRIFKCIRNGVFKISIPLIVFQELRSLRKSAEATIADAATRSVIIIRELYSAKEILPLRFDGTIASDINETTEFENNSNWRSGVDETILNSVNQQNEISKKILRGLNANINGILLDTKLSKTFRYCVLVTDDRNMRLRAKTIGVTSFQSKWLFSQLENTFYDKCID